MSNKKFYIYHIPGVKVGCSTNPKKRTKDQGFNSYEILECHEDIKIASEREIYFQEKFGYGRDNNSDYENSYKARIEAGKIGGKANKESGWITQLGFTQGKLNKENGTLLKAARLGGKVTGSNLSKEYLANLGKIGGNKKVTCPHCNKEGLARPMHRWHFNNCKYKNESK